MNNSLYLIASQVFWLLCFLILFYGFNLTFVLAFFISNLITLIFILLLDSNNKLHELLNNYQIKIIFLN